MRDKTAFPRTLRILAIQSGEDKLKIAFNLTSFVRKLRKEGERYDGTNNRPRTRKTS